MADRIRITISNLRNTSHIMKQTAATFSANFFTLLLLSLTLFTFRTFIEKGTLNLTSDASLQSLFSRLDIADRQHRRLHPRRSLRPDSVDPFTGKKTHDPSSDSAPLIIIPSNVSSLFLQDIDQRNGYHNKELPGIENRDSKSDDEGREGEEDELLSRQDGDLRFFLASFVPAYYVLMVFGFTVLYSCVLGIVHVVVMNDMLGRNGSCISGVVWVGCKFGVKKLTSYFLLRWAVRNAESHGVGFLFAPQVDDRLSFFKTFVWMKLVPFSIVFPWFFDLDRCMPGYFSFWWMLDWAVALLMDSVSWVTIVDARRTGREMKKSYDLLGIVFHEAFMIKCLEHVIVVGTGPRHHLTKAFGEFSASLFQSIAEVFFMVAWLILNFVARCREADSGGSRFGRKEIEGLLDGLNR